MSNLGIIDWTKPLETGNGDFIKFFRKLKSQRPMFYCVYEFPYGDNQITECHTIVDEYGLPDDGFIDQVKNKVPKKVTKTGYVAEDTIVATPYNPFKKLIKVTYEVEESDNPRQGYVEVVYEQK